VVPLLRLEDQRFRQEVQALRLAVVIGSRVQLFDREGRLRAEKTCDNPDHALRAGKSWANDEAKQVEALARYPAAA
jgi:hypothetical protein